MQVADDQVLAGAQHADEFSQYRLEAEDVDESERVDDDLHRVVRQRQPVQLSEVELAVWATAPRVGEHVR